MYNTVIDYLVPTLWLLAIVLLSYILFRFIQTFTDLNEVDNKSDYNIWNEAEEENTLCDLCSTCSVPIIRNTGNGVVEPLNPTLYCPMRGIFLDEPVTICEYHVPKIKPDES